jgi:Ser/Thr protein kinase RdoA (MazF antagonist)
LSQLSQLVKGLPERFRPSLEHLITKLPGLLAEDWPLVPNHNDLLENNIHVNPETGQIVGICDWTDTTIGPFGMSLGGLETMLGIRRIRGWCYHANQQELQALFWATIYNAIGQISEEQGELIEVARLLGIFLENGFAGDVDGNIVPASEGDETLDYLGAVTLGIPA